MAAASPHPAADASTAAGNRDAGNIGPTGIVPAGLHPGTGRWPAPAIGAGHRAGRIHPAAGRLSVPAPSLGACG
jgi:hypothetical protein